MKKLCILTGISGSGKTTIANELFKLGRNKALNFTTRSPRGEFELDDYVFLDNDTFNIKESNGDFIGVTDIYKNKYGLSKYLGEGITVAILDPVGKTKAIKRAIENGVEYKGFFINISKECQENRIPDRIDQRSGDANWFIPLSNDIIIDGEDDIFNIVTKIKNEFQN